MANPHPLISIITPSYNSSKFIQESIRSVQQQRYDRFEHIVIDGGSTDGTQEILKAHPHLRWISEPDHGQSDALNKGLAMANGDIIGWLNADDVYLEGTFEKVATILNDDGVDGVYANYYFADERLEVTRPLISHRPVKFLSLFHCFIPSTAFFFKRSVIDRNIRFDVDFDISMDKEFFAHIFYAGFRLKYSDDFYAKFRWHGTNKSVDNVHTRRIRFAEGLRIFNRYSSVKLPDSRLGVLSYFIAAKVLLFYKKYLKMFRS